jgi:hypothetical protein
MVYTKFVALNTIYNFVVQNFFIWDHLETQIFILSYWIFKFIFFWFFQMAFNTDTAYTSVVAPNVI